MTHGINQDPTEKDTVAEAIVFADVCQSTKLYDQLGDVRAHSMVSRALQTLEDEALKYKGRVVKKMGDAIMCAFSNPTDAVLGVCGMQFSISQDMYFVQSKLTVRVGLHYGNVLLDKGDVFGDAVNVASRAVNLASSQEIITTEDTISVLPQSIVVNMRHIGKMHVPGKSEKIDFYEILWQNDLMDLTSRIDSVELDLMQETSTRFIKLEVHGMEFTLPGDSLLLSLGRGQQNDIVIAEQCASRNHGFIKFRNSQFIFIDQSTNGSYISFRDEREIYIHRDEIKMIGSGVISLGQSSTKGEESLIKFFVQ